MFIRRVIRYCLYIGQRQTYESLTPNTFKFGQFIKMENIMPKKLFIVESPNKIKTLKKILGNDYEIKASIGHIRSIPRKGMNIDIKNNFTPNFEVSSDKRQVVKELKEAASKADEIFLATDEDREGEAISWHIYELFNKDCKKKCKRVTFDSITKSAVQAAINNKRDIDMNQVHAQHARQILDRLVGYKISPLLWFSVRSGTSAGRVQSIALKIVAQREKEIQAFKPTDFWYIDALLQGEKGDFWARVVTKDKDNRYIKDDLSTEDLEKLKKAKYYCAKVEKKERKVNAYAPFDTSSMLQAATSVLGWPVKKTTALAQKLYESGKCTYIRTDSFNISDEALEDVRSFIKSSVNEEYLPLKPNLFKKKSKAAAQEAHECIRPTHVKDTGDDISDSDEKKLYKLIRSRFVACQMAPMVLDTVTYTIDTDCKKTLISKGQTIKFDGWSRVYRHTNTKEEELPSIEEKEKLDLKDIKRTKHTTQPPPRYNEASLVKKMESEGVGRPSTYASIMESIQKRGYVVKTKDKKGALSATELGLKVFDFLENNFKDFFMDINFTSGLEDKLANIADGKKNYLEVIQDTFDILQSEIKKARENDKNNPKKADVTTGEKCQKCKKGYIIKRHGKFGDFFACDQHPECSTIYIETESGKFEIKKKKTIKKTGIPCPDCKKNGKNGELIERKNKRDGNIFFGCSNYPKCRFTKTPEKPGDGLDLPD
jgi:DNA topoisomerase I